MKYKTNELAKILGVTTNTIRRYENNGYIDPEKSDESGYRSYTKGDVVKIALIRQLRKCGFTHAEIEGFIGNTRDGIRDIAQNKLDAIDREILRLKHLRHWLKDNIQLMDVCKDIGKGFVFMDCPPVYYVLYSAGEKLLTEKERLDTIYNFMYTAEEVQHIELYKREYLDRNKYITYRGWAVKEMDIERLNLHDMMKTRKYIEYYPKQRCMYGILSMPSEYVDIPEKALPYIEDFNARKNKFLAENKLCECGDNMSFVLGTLGETADALVCMPVEEKK
ncbi:MAG: MerR family transcriptional regulator [Firmicutes bacterium]|nr:MerR family transcriptional regulator [Bacillota bacterium]